MRNHVILINHAKGQIETHEVNTDKFLAVYDLLHPEQKEVVEGLSFGAASRVPDIQEALADVQAKSLPLGAEPELEPEIEPAPVPEVPTASGNEKFMADLARLMG